NELVCCGVLSGNRNFEGRIHPNTRANYLASPLLVIAYAIAGRMDIDFETEPIGNDKNGKPVFLKNIWPSRAEIQSVEKQTVIPAMFQDVYSRIENGSNAWQYLQAPDGQLYPWDESSTYIKNPPFFNGMTKTLPGVQSVKGAHVLLFLGDSVTTDHISPAGNIARNSSAARYLASRNILPKDYNSYGSRRGNDEVMVRGTFANTRIINKLASTTGPKTIHIPSGQELDVFDAAQMYAKEGRPLIAIVGKDYGSGSSRDWAAKGTSLLGIKAVIAESYERIHRSNLVGMGIITLQFRSGENAETLKLTGHEIYDIDIPQNCKPLQEIQVKTNTGVTFDAILRFDTNVDILYHKHGGILNHMIRKIERTGWTNIIEPQLKGAAGTWWNTIRLLDYTWDEFRTNFLKKFHSMCIQSALQEEVMTVRQSPTQSLTEFITHKHQLTRRINNGQRPSTFADLHQIAELIDTPDDPPIPPPPAPVYTAPGWSRTSQLPRQPRMRERIPAPGRPLPRDPCRYCGGPHWNSECPGNAPASGNVR
ncbi:cytoplasmic aconitate hydratase-like, partial [Aphis craccivora]